MKERLGGWVRRRRMREEWMDRNSSGKEEVVGWMDGRVEDRLDKKKV